MFMGRIAKHPNDVLIFGWAIGMAHREGKDDVSEADLRLRPWKAKWPHYVGVHDAEFVAGTLANGVSVNKMMAVLGTDAFASTQRNTATGWGNTNPRIALRQQAAVELSPQGHAWLGEMLERAFRRHGKLSADALATLDWPEVATEPDVTQP